METVQYWTGIKYVDVYPLSYLLNPTEELAASIATGPQDDFFEELDRCNEFIPERLRINVTPTWRWKPGSYNKVQEYLIERLRINDKCNSISGLMRRTREYSYYLQHLATHFEGLESKKYQLSNDGYRANINIPEFKEQMNCFVNRISEQIEIVKRMTNNKINIDVCLSNVEHARHANLYTSITMKDLEISIFNGNSCVQKIKLEPIHIIVEMNFRKFLLQYNKKAKFRNSSYWRGLYDSKLFSDAFTRVNRDPLETSFPYIARPYLDHTHDKIQYGTVCLDKYTDEVKNAFSSLNWADMIVSLMTWAQYYNANYSNPYNAVDRLYFGTPKSFSKEHLALFPYSSSCFNRVLRKHKAFNKPYTSFEDYDNMANAVSMCDSIKCVHREKGVCAGYKIMNSRINNFNNEYYKCFVESFVGYLMEEQGMNHKLINSMNSYFSYNADWSVSLVGDKEIYFAKLSLHLLSTRNVDQRVQQMMYYLLDETSYWSKAKTPEEELTEVNVNQADEVLRWATNGGIE